MNLLQFLPSSFPSFFLPLETFIMILLLLSSLFFVILCPVLYHAVLHTCISFLPLLILFVLMEEERKDTALIYHHHHCHHHCFSCHRLLDSRSY